MFFVIRFNQAVKRDDWVIDMKLILVILLAFLCWGDVSVSSATSEDALFVSYNNEDLGNPEDGFALAGGMPGQRRSMWYKDPIDFSDDFSLTYMFSMDAHADGFAFAFHNDGRSLDTVIGEVGGNLGIYGSQAAMDSGMFVRNGLALEIDTHYNYENTVPNDSDVPYSPATPYHVAFRHTEDVTSHHYATSLLTTGDLPVNTNHAMTVIWDAQAQELTYILNETVVNSYAFDPLEVFGSSMAYWGFSGSTGNSINNIWVQIETWPNQISVLASSSHVSGDVYNDETITLMVELTKYSDNPYTSFSALTTTVQGATLLKALVLADGISEEVDLADEIVLDHISDDSVSVILNYQPSLTVDSGFFILSYPGFETTYTYQWQLRPEEEIPIDPTDPEEPGEVEDPAEDSNGDEPETETPPEIVYVVQLQPLVDDNNNDGPEGSSGNGSSLTSSYTVSLSAGVRGTLVGPSILSTSLLSQLDQRARVVADEGYEFIGWSLDGINRINPDELAVDANHSLTALYQERGGLAATIGDYFSGLTGSLQQQPFAHTAARWLPWISLLALACVLEKDLRRRAKV